MENRILILGDEFLGEQGEAANRCSEMILCREANRPIQFSINAPAPQSMAQLLTRASSDIIGKKAGRLIIGLGLRELKRGGVDYNGVFDRYSALASELLNKTTAPLHFLTIPEDMFPPEPAQLTALNERIFELAGRNEKRVFVEDFAAHAAKYKEKQLERGKFGRSLYTEEGRATPLCNMLLGLFMYDFIIREIK
ncbi:hypothetical protein SAMN05720766_104141 [Fibrobacter sp. UWH9]|uniref:hypothetical protein n=1 Tax=unclassified Fibrobacter TaxID=2634177 RepID=UPI00091A670E|nr:MULTISPECIES: hypothetical protein [unclassified Fibrobacter]MCL4101498.1 hypothetical protein [Fibrobacter succinogenes]MCQ2100845.1 hypothetical protein [Fibrobacter sp.]MDO4946928.1 hypothetical protein [Fibrobacter sp.]OWV07292.1 hypothetical protein B7993_03550 [Fibrobacter sp. UWH3]OWV15915.1 hypothetical protein B7992_03880 [Fibrobacter sp. UWH1]